MLIICDRIKRNEMSPSSSSADSTKDVEKKSVQRRINKPLIEKRRRARINDCLAQLKSIVLEATDAKTPRPSKLEKADILEMTVEFVKKMLRNNGQTQPVPELAGQEDYKAGYAKCLAEISLFLEQTTIVNSNLKKDIVKHVSSKLIDGPLLPEAVPEKMEVTSEKIPILPLKKRTDTRQNDAEAMDLSLTKKSQSEEGVEKNIPVNISSNQLVQQMQPNHVSNTSLPVGLLCGSQVMLLLQLPPSLSSSQVLVQNSISGPSLNEQGISYPVNMVQPHQIPVIQSYVRPESIQNGGVLDDIAKSNSGESISDNKEEMKGVEHDRTLSSAADVSKTGEHSSRDHWRPW